MRDWTRGEIRDTVGATSESLAAGVGDRLRVEHCGVGRVGEGRQGHEIAVGGWQRRICRTRGGVRQVVHNWRRHKELRIG